MIEIKLKDDVIFNSFENQEKLNVKILQLINDSKTENILYKGNPMEINYKILKKILPKKDENNIQLLDLNSDNLRISFENFVNEIKSKYCLIYKE